MTGLNSWFMSSCSFFFCSTVFFYQNQNNNFILLERLEEKKKKKNIKTSTQTFPETETFLVFCILTCLIVQYFMSVPLVGSPSPKSLCMQNSNVPFHDLVYFQAQLIEGIPAVWSRTVWSILPPSPFFAECFTIIPQGDPATKMEKWSKSPNPRLQILQIPCPFYHNKNWTKANSSFVCELLLLSYKCQ